MNMMGARMNWVWRLFMTGFCFVLFGVGGLLLSMVWFNLLLITVRDGHARRRIARHSISASFRFFLWVTKKVGALDYRIENAETLRNEQSCLIVANHPTLIDYVLLASVMPEMDCLVKSTLLRNPFVSGVIRSADYLINSQGDALLPESFKRLQRGDTILIFPEGTRTSPGKKMVLQRGASNIAVRCSSDIRIVLIRCSQHLLDKQSRWYDIPPEKPIFEVLVRERVQINRFYDTKTQEPSLVARQLNRYLLQKLQLAETPLSETQ